eukprot:2922603-Rhodomonas_salina.2
MRYNKLGDSDLLVSEACLGTMTWGKQNSEEEAMRQLDIAFKEYGVNFIDTAEGYPIPLQPETSGLTDKMIGKWMKNQKREDVILAAKVSYVFATPVDLHCHCPDACDNCCLLKSRSSLRSTSLSVRRMMHFPFQTPWLTTEDRQVSGASRRLTWLRDDNKGTRVSREQIFESVDKSLARLQVCPRLSGPHRLLMRTHQNSMMMTTTTIVRTGGVQVASEQLALRAQATR